MQFGTLEVDPEEEDVIEGELGDGDFPKIDELELESCPVEQPPNVINRNRISIALPGALVGMDAVCKDSCIGGDRGTG